MHHQFFIAFNPDSLAVKQCPCVKIFGLLIGHFAWQIRPLTQARLTLKCDLFNWTEFGWMMDWPKYKRRFEYKQVDRRDEMDAVRKTCESCIGMFNILLQIMGYKGIYCPFYAIIKKSQYYFHSYSNIIWANTSLSCLKARRNLEKIQAPSD